MYGRFDSATLRLLHWSTVPFTSLPAPGEVDHVFDGPISLPGPIEQVRAKADWSGLELDPALMPKIFAGQPVFTAADVDRVTAARIRTLIGGVEPIQEQLKQLRLTAAAVYVNDHAADPNGIAYTNNEKAAALAVLQAGVALNAQIEALRKEGTNFKAAQGWN